LFSFFQWYSVREREGEKERRREGEKERKRERERERRKEREKKKVIAGWLFGCGGLPCATTQSA